MVYVVLTMVFFVPFGVTTQSILDFSDKPELKTITNAINRAFWPLFHDVLTILKEFERKCLKSI